MTESKRQFDSFATDMRYIMNPGYFVRSFSAVLNEIRGHLSFGLSSKLSRLCENLRPRVKRLTHSEPLSRCFDPVPIFERHFDHHTLREEQL